MIFSAYGFGYLAEPAFPFRSVKSVSPKRSKSPLPNPVTSQPSSRSKISSAPSRCFSQSSFR